ncbi:MAG: AAA family ATPase, partial [Anaerolineales bacterium]|nr:AAA family ATPase [Anaerolineales bacterium]
ILSTGRLGADGRTRLLNEARAAARLNHPNVVSIFDAGEAETGAPSEMIPSVVMELVDGPSLFEQKPDSLDQIVRIARQISAALDHAHNHGIIHRDIKPENVLVQHDGIAKLTDFGLARSISSRLSGEGEIAGTVFYMAPELALGTAYDGRADLYSLGVLLYELSVGELPFVADDPLAVISQHLHSPVVPPRARNPEISIPLENLILDLLAKQPEDRPDSAADVVARIDQLDRPGPETALAEFPLLKRIVRGRMVGRTAEIEEARSYLAQALAGQATVLLISGEPGIGKTRLAREMIAQARVRGAVILEGGCYEYEATTPYLPMAEALRDWIHKKEPEELRSVLAESAAEINRLAPEVEAKLGKIPPNPPLSAQEERLRMFDHLARFLGKLAQDSGLVLFLDDLHWADRGTLSLLPYILRRLRSARFLVLATYREIELDRTHPLSAALVEWNRERLANRITLGRLSYDDTVHFLEVLFDQPQVSDEFTEAVYRETEGNPFFIEEVIKALIEQGTVYRVGDHWEREELHNLAIPQSIKEAIGRRLNQLDPFTVELLHTASVYGKDFPYSILSSAYPDRENDVLDALEETERAQLIRPEGGERFIFTHDKIREVLYEEQNAIRRRRTHIRLAELMEQSNADDLERIAPDLSYHFVQGGDMEKCYGFSLIAAESSARLFAFDEALQYYADAQACIESSGSDQELAGIYDAKGDIYSQIGPVTEAIKQYELALDHLADPVERARVLTKSGGLMITVGDLTGRELVRAALDELDAGDYPAERAIALIFLGRYFHLTAEYRRALEIYDEALELADHLQDPFIVTELYAFIAGTYQHLTEFEES